MSITHLFNFRRWRWDSRSSLPSVLGLIGVIAVVSVGSLHAFTRGGKDFDVFYQAWHLVLSGRGEEIYRNSPDRFLYAPAFAWLLSPFGLLSPKISLGVWCGIKILLVAAIVWGLSESLQRLSRDPRSAFTVGIWSILFVSRPILIDFEYGQVNLLILGACFWGLWTHFDREKNDSPLISFLSWFALTFAALAKLYPLPLLLVPWMRTHDLSKKHLHAERWGVVLCMGLMVFLPVFSQGWSGAWNLFLDWQAAILARGLPLESHNQSFVALLNHYWGGGLTHALSEKEPLQLGFSSLDATQIALLSLFWSFFSFGVILTWMLRPVNIPALQWIAVAVGLLIIPSHLIWKPYFVFSLPLSAWMIHRALIAESGKFWILVVGLFFGINFTGFDFVGHPWGAQLEAASFLLLMHVLMLGVGLKQFNPRSSLAS